MTRGGSLNTTPRLWPGVAALIAIQTAAYAAVLTLVL